MRNKIINIAIAILIIISTPNVFADGKVGDEDKKSNSPIVEQVIDRINSTFNFGILLEDLMISAGEKATEELFFEQELVLEDWMIEEFNVEESMLENEMVLEEWMTEEFEIEELKMDMELEGWMLEPFDQKESFVEEELVLEDWMLKF